MPSSAAVYAPIDSGFAQGTVPVHIALHQQRDENGVVPQQSRRRKWWWESGPMDTWSLILTLRMGVTFTALWLLFNGCGQLNAYISVPGDLVNLQDQYAEDCGGLAAESRSCVDIAENIKILSEIDDQLFPAVLQDGLISFVPGAIGLAAAYLADPRAVKLFLWTYLARCGMEQVRIFIGIARRGGALAKINWYTLAVAELFIVLTSLYILKGIWSYQMQLLRRRNAVIPSSSPGVSERGMIDSVSQDV